MNDEEVIHALRAAKAKGCNSATELAKVLGSLIDGELSDASLIMYFKQAFPSIPLRILREAGAWQRVSGGDLCDGEFDELLAPWIG